MPEPQDPDEDQGEGSVGNSTIQQMRKQLKDLETRAKAAEEARTVSEAALAEKDAALAGYTKNAAFDRLNIPSTGPGKLFRNTYQGELTDESILSLAAEYGIVQAPQATAPTIPGVDQAAMQRMQASLSGSQPNQQNDALAQIEALSKPGVPNGREATLDLLRSLGLTDTSQGA